MESVVAILEPNGITGDRPTVIRAGPVAASDEELFKLCNQMRGNGVPAGAAGLNEVRAYERDILSQR